MTGAPSEIDWLVILASDRSWASAAIERYLTSGFSVSQLAIGGPAEAPWLANLRERTGCRAFAWEPTDDSARLARALGRLERDAASELLDFEVKKAMETGALALLGDPARAVELAHFAYAVAGERGLGLRATERVIRLALYLPLAREPELERIVLCSRNLWPIRSLLNFEATGSSAPVPAELEVVRLALARRDGKERRSA